MSCGVQSAHGAFFFNTALFCALNSLQATSTIERLSDSMAARAAQPHAKQVPSKPKPVVEVYKGPSAPPRSEAPFQTFKKAQILEPFDTPATKHVWLATMTKATKGKQGIML